MDTEVRRGRAGVHPIVHRLDRALIRAIHETIDNEIGEPAQEFVDHRDARRAGAQRRRR
jgi:hypothetical protein